MRYIIDRLRQRKKLKIRPADRPRVNVVVEGTTGFGRAILRGVMRYANLQRQWLIFPHLQPLLLGPRRMVPSGDGVIIAGVADALCPIVASQSRFAIRCSGGADPAKMPVVCMDDEAVGALAAQHLIDCRLQHFAFYGRMPNLAERRFQGFSNALKAKGFSCIDAGLGWVLDAEMYKTRHMEKIITWLRSLPNPIGIMAVDDSAARVLSAACLEADIGVPNRIAIIGVNNDDLICDSAWPPLSSVDCDYSRVGYAAAEMLDQQLKGKKLSTDERLVRMSPLGVIQRQSTDLVAVDDRDVADAVRFIREHACDPCSVPDVLQHIPVGRRWLERQFKAKIGRNPNDEILRVRVETATRLLLQPNLTLTTIAERCGFGSVHNFCRTYHRIRGVSPGAFRREVMIGARL